LVSRLALVDVEGDALLWEEQLLTMEGWEAERSVVAMSAWVGAAAQAVELGDEMELLLEAPRG